MAKTIFRVFLLVFVLLASPSTQAAVESSSLTVDRMRCEYLANPLGLDVAQPRLDWVLIAKAQAPRHLQQQSYHILVASTMEQLAQDKGDLWDSGEVKSDATDHIAYAGAALSSREDCYWKVRVTDSLGQATAWSKPAFWEMGLLKPEDWQAKWIDGSGAWKTNGRGGLSILHASYESTDSPDAKDVTAFVAGLVKDNTLSVPISNDALGGDAAPQHVKQLHVSYSVGGQTREATGPEGSTLEIPNRSSAPPYLRKDFTVAKRVAKARVYATALGLYVLRLNGTRVGDHIFAPDWTDYSKRLRYQVYDVTALVKTGANTLAGMLGNGWYAGHIGNGGYQAWGKVPALFAQLEITYTDGTSEVVVTDVSWKVHQSPITASDFMLGEDFDARREIPGWDKPGLNTSDWVPAIERSEAPRPLDGQVDQPVVQTVERVPKADPVQASPGHWVYDLGQNMVGVVRLKVSAPAGTHVTLRHAEMLNTNGTIYTANLRGAPSVDTYVCKGGGVEIWQPAFTFHGFRYVELSGLPTAPARDAVTGIVIGTDIPHTGDFSCSNADVNQLQSNIQWGMRGNYLSVPTDCPQRDERMGWMGDAEVFIRTAAYNGDIAAFFAKWLVDVDDAQKPDGEFTDVTPSPQGAGGGNGGVPAWGDAGVICPWTVYLMYDDKRILEQHLPAMKRWVDWCQVHSTNLLRDHDRGPDYGDWLSQGEDTPKDLIGTAYFAYSTSLLAKAYAVVGDDRNSTKYQQLFDQIKTAFNQAYVSADGHIKGDTQSDYCMALRFGLLPEELRSKAAQLLADNVAKHQNHLTTGFIGVSYLLPALCSQNQLATAYHLFEQDTFPAWLFSVKQGATTMWERWDGWTPDRGFQSPSMNSFNHYSLGSCGEWMFDTVAGIGVDPNQPGFKHIIIRPRPGGTLTQAKGTFDSIQGRIATEWTLQGGTFSLHLTIPINTTATVILPTLDGSSIRENSQAVTADPDIKTLSSQDGESALSVGSGDYHFTCSMSLAAP